MRTSSGHGSFTAAAFEPDGSIVLLLDQHDGVRLLKTSGNASTVIAQAQAGSTGDSGVAMALDLSGNIYVTGTSISGTLHGTGSTVYANPADTTTNSFLAKFDANLNLVFLTFLGAGKTAAASVAVTADSVFVSGITYSTTFPVTAAGIQQSPASGSTENGFVERISADGSTLVYATYLTGLNGNTIPTAIAADASDNAYVTGSTTSSGFPTIAALEPTILGATSGFLARLTPSGNAFTFSTFIAGNGLTSMALDTSSASLLLTGNVALGQFPVATVAQPLTSASYQTLLRIPTDGQSVSDSVLLVPGIQSYVSSGPGKTAWISGILSTPLFPGVTPPDYAEGDSFLLHITATDAIDQTFRFGGQTVNNASYASLTTVVAAPAVSSDGVTAALPATLTASLASSLLATQRFDLPMAVTPTTAVPNGLRDVLPTAAACGTSSQCTGTGAILSLVTTASSVPSLSLSTDNHPNVTLRNLGSATATGLAIVASGYVANSNCGLSLAASSQCSIALSGSGPGSLTVSASNAPSYTASLPATTLSPDALALSTTEIDFGIASAASPAVARSMTVTNLTPANQTFTVARDGGPATTPYTLAVSSTNCPATGPANTFTISASTSCNLTFSLAASNIVVNDGPVRSVWKVGTRDVALTGFAQAAALNVSASEVDFGTQFTGANAIRLPRYLYLSNNSRSALTHIQTELPVESPFAITDECPSVLEPHSLCRLTLHYDSRTAPASDSALLNLDQGSTVLLTGTTRQPASVTGTSSNPTLGVSPASINFATPVVVTGISTGTQTIIVTNTGANAFALAVSLSGDFKLTNGCTGTLAGGASCQILISFAPSQPGTRQGVLSVTAGSGFSPTYVALSGNGLGILPANNGTLDLGQTLVGEPVIAWYKVQQSLTSLTVTTGSADFGVVLVPSTGSTPSNLSPSSFARTATGACNSCYLGVQFLAQNFGSESTSFTLSTIAAGNAYPLTLTATALPVQGMLLTPIAQDFGPVAINSSTAPATFTLANLLTPSAGATVQSVVASGDFSIPPNATGGSSCSGSLVATASCFVQLVFAPTATGQRSGTLTVVTSAGTATAALSGYGLPDPGLALNPQSLSFQSVPGSAATQQTITLSNTGTVTLTIGTLVTTDGSFTPSSNCTSLAPGALCTVSVTFTPQAGPVDGTLLIPVTSTINGQTSTTNFSVALNGVTTTQTAGLEILPNVVNFGSTAAESLGPTRQFTLNNLSGKALKVDLEMPRQFVLATSNPCAALAVGASCTFSVTFLPATAGSLTGTVFAHGTPTDGSATVETLNYLMGYGSSMLQMSIGGIPVPNTPVSFGQVTSGQAVSKTLTLSNGSSTVMTVRRVTSEPPFLTTTTCGAALAAGGSCSIVVSYAPVNEVSAGSSAGPRNDAGTLVIESDAASSPDVVELSGAAAPITSSSPSTSAIIAALDLSQGSLTFPQIAVGSQSSAQGVTLTNIGTTTVHVGSTLASVDFLATADCSTLFPRASCNVIVEFAPTASSTSALRSGTVEILSDAGTSLEFISVVGSSTATTISLSPSSLNFGSVDVGSSGALSETVTNTGSTSVTFLAVNASADYSVSRGSCPAVGSALAAGGSCVLTVTFTPTAAGVRTGTLSVSTSATALPLTVPLTGAAVVVAPPPPSFALTVNGGTAATVTVASGSGIAATYALLVTPLNGFTGTVALTCTPVVPAQYASCSVLASMLTFSGTAAQSSTATINTVTSTTGAFLGALVILTVAPILGLVLVARPRRRRSTSLLVVIAGFVLGGVAGCGGKASPVASGPKLNYTPVGTYQYQVTASSTSGTQVSSTVTLNLIVQ
ncbi:MAG: choice-of-anchor D domain-containing protein [Acidobacteriota bacterium]